MGAVAQRWVSQVSGSVALRDNCKLGMIYSLNSTVADAICCGMLNSKMNNLTCSSRVVVRILYASRVVLLTLLLVNRCRQDRDYWLQVSVKYQGL